MLQPLWDWLRINAMPIFWIIIGLSFFVELTPIKINPWSILFKWIGKKMTGDACTKIDTVLKKIKDIEETADENEKDRIRWEILSFANSCRNGVKHTRDEYQHIITLDGKYKKLLEKTHDTNGVFEVEFEYIKKLYAERLEKNDFLA